MTSRPSRATSYDVARLAGVSQSAVSRCFKPGASISAKMRDRVMSAARELGYQPNAMARGLITKRSGLVAVFVASTMNFYYPDVLFQLTQRFAEHGMRVLLFTLDSEADATAALDPVWQYSVDGVISASHLSGAQYEWLQERGIPVIMFNRWFADHTTDGVVADSAEAASEMVEHMVEGGHRRVALLRGPESSMVGRNRMDQVEAALSRSGITPVASSTGTYHYDSGLAAAETLLSSEPTLIVAANDMMAMGLIDALRFDHGVRVPEDVSICGFDGIAAGQFAPYRLTTVRQPIGRMADAAASLLMQRLEREDVSPETRQLGSTLLLGQSTRALQT